MARRNKAKLTEHFAAVPDPRVDRTKRHLLHDIIVIAICGVICGADDWVAIESFGKAKKAWFRRFLRLPHGIPSHDTFGRVFAAIDTEAFTACFVSWIQSVADLTSGEVVAIDGKTLRRSFDRASSKAAIHMVSAWAAANRLVLGQVKTEEKSNEITAIPKLLRLLEIKGCIVTIDAMGCQKHIAATIVGKEADYVLNLKANQPALHMQVEEYFKEALKAEFVGAPFDYHEEEGYEHGRYEIRRVWCTSDIAWLDQRTEWAGLRSIGMVEAERVVDANWSLEHRYYISSLAGDDAEQFAHAVRAHWGIESMHWILDIAFREDDSRARKKNAAQNLALLRHIALNLLKNEKTAKIGVKNKRLKAGWDERYLLRVLGF